MIEWLDNHLVPEWRKAHKMASVHLAALVSTIITAFAANPHVLFTLLNYLPADPVGRALVALGIGFVALFGPVIMRLWQQGGTDAAAE